jgi:hypothetical protein
MKRKSLNIILLTAALFCHAALFSQGVTTILYDNTSGLSTTKCNVFNPAPSTTPVSVGGKVHVSVIGAATFTAANGLTLPTNYSFTSGTGNRSDYRISYPFKSGYKYSIAITALGSVSGGSSYPTIGGDLFTASGLTFTSTSCAAGNIGGFPGIGGLFIFQLTNTSTTYSPTNATNFIPNFNYDYLLLEASCTSAQNITANAFIKKVVITETAPVSFTLPANTAIPCGSSAQKSFAVTNVYNTTGVTNYVWNLGANNGWLYNGVAAPATISTGTTASIILTPVCGSALSNVSATVTANGTAYNTNTSTVAITPPVLSINGSAGICGTSSNYSINGLPACGAAVTWSLTPATGVASLSCTSCATTTVTKIANGNVILKATVVRCGNTQTLQLPLNVGSLDVTKLSVVGEGPGICPNVPIMFGARYNGNCTNFNAAGITDITWNVAPTPTQIVYNAGTAGCTGSVNNAGVTIKFPSTSTQYNVKITATNACGTTSFCTPYVVTIMPGCPSNFVMVSPNSARNEVTVTSIKKTPDYAFDDIKVYDLQGNLKKQYSYKKVNTAKINITNLANGIYLLEVTNGTVKDRQQLVVQK